MGKVTGFLEIDRKEVGYEPVNERIVHFREFVVELTNDELRDQGARCMDCGIPYCQSGCPVDNIIPDWNDLVYRDDWKQASEVLHSTNNFPEFTGRVCPAPCEASCTLNIQDNPVTIKSIEKNIAERAWQEGWVLPEIPRHRTGRSVSVIGSGPAGLACAQQLVRAGHYVSIYEKQDRSGGLLRYGIPDFKLDKMLIDRRMAQMKTEGVRFHSGTHVGVDIPLSYFLDNFDVIVLAGGSEEPRDLEVAGRNLKGVHFAMDFLRSNTRRVQCHNTTMEEFISAEGKDVIVVGGGDTGSDCIGTSIRQGCQSVTQIEILSEPPEKEDKGLTWPNWPHKMRISTSQAEGCERIWDVKTQSIMGGATGQVTALNCIKVAWNHANGQWKMKDIAGSEFTLKADMVLLAMGFVHPVYKGLLETLGVDIDTRGNVKADNQGANAYHTSLENVFVAGDMRRGQSLVVWAIHEGRQCARAVDIHLRGKSDLPSR